MNEGDVASLGFDRGRSRTTYINLQFRSMYGILFTQSVLLIHHIRLMLVEQRISMRLVSWGERTPSQLILLVFYPLHRLYKHSLPMSLQVAYCHVSNLLCLLVSKH